MDKNMIESSKIPSDKLYIKNQILLSLEEMNIKESPYEQRLLKLKYLYIYIYIKYIIFSKAMEILGEYEGVDVEYTLERGQNKMIEVFAYFDPNPVGCNDHTTLYISILPHYTFPLPVQNIFLNFMPETSTSMNKVVYNIYIYIYL